MAKNNKADMSCARVKKYTASDVSKAERHNERKNETYENMNVIEERIPYNVHFKKPTAPTYMEQLKQMETDGQVSLRGLREDATLFNEIVIDVNTMYFERNGGYEYAKQFYEEAYRFIEEKFGSDNVISAVMHADEINIAATEELGKEVYHYHLHAMVLPVVEKEILWSKRCKDPELRGTVKEVVNQISHSKKWKSDIPLTDEKGKPFLRKNGKPMFRASYSILQDELFHFMTEQGFKGFQRGEYGSTAEHLTSLQYQIIFVEKELQRVNREAMADLDGKDIMFKFPPTFASTHTALVLKTPKTKTSVRKVFLPKTVAEMLVQRKADIEELKDLFGDEFVDFNLVFCSSNGKPIEGQVINRAFNKLIEEKGLPKVVFHSLRHSSITYKLKLNGGDMKSVQGDSGHAQVKMVADVYSHIIDDDRRLNAERMEAAFYSGRQATPEPVQPAATESSADDKELLLKLLQNPEMAALLKSLAKTL